MITKESLIEDILTDVPGAAGYLMAHGIQCIRCGEPVWGTLTEVAEKNGFDEYRIEGFVNDLNRLQTAH